ncbi:ABC transporter substrate-binding protein [Ruminococcaceae bacterium OttesenSCG-928-A16]|nr:ABC transporter substrate-binding protein [Ruminococcaceae bacterium OttesenSCG-928-A16]
MKKKMFALLTVVMLAMGLLAACGTGGGATSTAAPPASGQPAASTAGATGPQIEIDTAGGKVKIVFWHSMGGRNQEALDKLVGEYNASQDKVEVEAQYQGTYDDAITKLRSTNKGSGPDIMQMYDIGTRWTIDSGYALKMQDYIDADSYDISDYEANILAYYTLDGSLYSMPFNCSSPVLVYNKEALEKTGLSAEEAFKDLDACLATAELMKEKGGMEVGGSFTNYSWVFEQMMSLQGKDFVDNGNGRTDRATKMVIGENGAGLALLEKWKSFSSQPYTSTFGKGTAESKTQFATGTVGFILDSCSVYVDISSAAAGSFSVGFAPLPKVSAADDGGVSVGGGSLWLMDNADNNKAAAAWDFIKFATQPEQQAEWSIGTGYLPIRTSALELDFYQDYINNTNPELIVAIEALQQSKPQYAGSVMGVFPQARVIVENEIETMLNDPSSTAEDTLNNIITQIDAEIEMYNKTN